jgi:hypothetical protein
VVAVLRGGASAMCACTMGMLNTCSALGRVACSNTGTTRWETAAEVPSIHKRTVKRLWCEDITACRGRMTEPQ